MTDWRPIETAPKDGTVILAGSAAKHMKFIFVPYPLPSVYVRGLWRAVEPSGRLMRYEPQPTHWVPMNETVAPITGPCCRRKPTA